MSPYGTSVCVCVCVCVRERERERERGREGGREKEREGEGEGEGERERGVLRSLAKPGDSGSISITVRKPPGGGQDAPQVSVFVLLY